MGTTRVHRSSRVRSLAPRTHDVPWSCVCLCVRVCVCRGLGAYWSCESSASGDAVNSFIPAAVGTSDVEEVAAEFCCSVLSGSCPLLQKTDEERSFSVFALFFSLIYLSRTLFFVCFSPTMITVHH